jgi:hypothetical protein
VKKWSATLLLLFVSAALIGSPFAVYGVVWALDALGVDTTQLPGVAYLALLTLVPGAYVLGIGRALRRTTLQVTITMAFAVGTTTVVAVFLVVRGLSNADLN